MIYDADIISFNLLYEHPVKSVDIERRFKTYSSESMLFGIILYNLNFTLMYFLIL